MGALHESRVRNRVELPTYPFERQRYWIEPRLTVPLATTMHSRGLERLEPEQWFYEPALCPKSLSSWHLKECSGLWVVFEEGRGGWIDLLAERLENAGQSVVRIQSASDFEQIGEQLYRLDPTRAEHYERLFNSLTAKEGVIRVICSWIGTDSPFGGLTVFFQLSRALQVLLGKISVDLCIVTEGLYSIAGETDVHPERMMLSGLDTSGCKNIQWLHFTWQMHLCQIIVFREQKSQMPCWRTLYPPRKELHASIAGVSDG
ncbi:KR prefix domain-containing protein [Paenibacillus larvae]|uniref:KR prefix domain-containing protein n=1 Tax=Paenibacillus larvae TaxID=1464 RepID=UPI0018DB8850|nr:hypothetical protein [Paenibacillus larvae]